MTLPYACTTGCVEDAARTPFSLHASIETPTQLRVMLVTFLPSGVPEPTVRAYRVSSDSTAGAAYCSLKNYLSRFSHTVGWDSSEPARQTRPGDCEVCGASEDGSDNCREDLGGETPFHYGSGTVRALHLMQHTQQGGNDGGAGAVHIALENAHWHSDAHVSVDVAVLFVCGCVFLLRVHLPLAKPLTFGAATTAPALEAAHLDTVLRVPLARLWSRSDLPVPAAPRDLHLSLTTVRETVPHRRPHAPASAASPERLCVLVSLDARRLCVIECTRPAHTPPLSPPAHWTVARLGTLAVALHHAHPFHLFGRCTHLRQLRWLSGGAASLDFTGTTPLVAMLYQYMMPDANMAEAVAEPPADHLALASVFWRSSTVVPCTWQSSTASAPAAPLATSCTLSSGVLTDGPWRMRHMALPPFATLLLCVPSGHVGLFLRAPRSPALPSVLLRATTATPTATSATHTFRLLEAVHGTTTVDVPVNSTVECAVALAVHGVGNESAGSRHVATLAVLGVSSEALRSTGAQSVASAWTLALVHVTEKGVAGSPSSTSSTSTAAARAGSSAEVLYAAMPPESTAGLSSTCVWRLVGGWWHVLGQRGLLRLEALAARHTDGALAWTDTRAVALTMVSGRLQAAWVPSAVASFGAWPRPTGPFTLADLLRYHTTLAAGAVREAQRLAGSPSDDVLGLEVVLRAPVVQGDGVTTTTTDLDKDATADVLLLRNGLFVSVSATVSDCADPSQPFPLLLRVLGRLQWPAGPLRGEDATTTRGEDGGEDGIRRGLAAREAAVTALLSSEPDAALAAVLSVPSTLSVLPLQLMVCVVKGWAILLEPVSGQVRQALRLAVGLAPSQLSLSVLPDPPVAAASDEDDAVMTSRARAVVFVAGLRVPATAEVTTPIGEAPLPSAALTSLEPFLATLTLTERVYRPLAPVLCPTPWVAPFASEPLRSELAGVPVAALPSPVARASHYDLTRGDAVVLTDTEAQSSTTSPSRWWWDSPPAFLLWQASPVEADSPFPAFSLCLSSASLSRGALLLTARLVAADTRDGGHRSLTLPDTHRVTLCTVAETVSPPLLPSDASPASTWYLLGDVWPPEETVLFTAVLPLRGPVPDQAGDAGVSLVVVHHHHHVSPSPGSRRATEPDLSIPLHETVLLVWPGYAKAHVDAAPLFAGTRWDGGRVYALHTAPLHASGLGQPPAAFAQRASQTSTTATTRYLLGLATRDAHTPLCVELNWSVAASMQQAEAEAEVAAHRTANTPGSDDATHTWRGPLPAPPQWLRLVSD